MKKILVIEDDDSVQWFARRMVPDDSQLIMVRNYIDAWTWLAEGNVCDLIVSEFGNPKDGFDLLEHVRGSTMLRNIPVIMLSGINALANLPIAQA